MCVQYYFNQTIVGDIPADRGDQDHGDVPDVDASLGGRDGVQIVPRRGRGRQGVRRDKLLQPAISNFTVNILKNSGVGGTAGAAVQNSEK